VLSLTGADGGRHEKADGPISYISFIQLSKAEEKTSVWWQEAAECEVMVFDRH